MATYVGKLRATGASRPKLGQAPVVDATLVVDAAGRMTKPIQVISLRVEQEEGMLDSVTVVSHRTTASDTTKLPKPPVSVQWGRATMPLGTFYGYIDTSGVDVEWARTYTGMQQIQLLGAAWNGLQHHRQEVWRDRTVPEIVAAVAHRNRFAAVISGTHTYRWGTIAQDESDVALLARLADQIGWAVVFDNTTIRLFEREDVLANSPQAPLVEWSEAPREFTFHIIDAPYAGKRQVAERSATYIDVLTGKPQTIAMMGNTPTVLASRPVDNSFSVAGTRFGGSSYADAEQIIKAEVKRNAMWLEAEIDCLGNASVRPGQLVNVVVPDSAGQASTGDKRSRLAELYTGLWYVRKAVHTVNLNAGNNGYRMSLSVLRDGRGVTTGVNLQRFGLRSTPSLRQEPPARILLGRWVAAWAE